MSDDTTLDMEIHERLFGWNPTLHAVVIPRYSTQASDNLHVQTWLAERQWWENRKEEKTDEGGVRLTLARPLPPGKVEAVGATEFEAICRAALKVKAKYGE